MKFAEHLASHLTPEWRKQYVNYDKMKKMLYIICDKAPSQEEDPESEVRRRYLVQKEEEFFNYCTDELNKINLFFNQKLAEAQTKFRDLNRDVDIFSKLAKDKASKDLKSKQDTVAKQHLKRLSRGQSNVPDTVDGQNLTLVIDNHHNGKHSSAEILSLQDKALSDSKSQLVDDVRLPKSMRECQSAFAEFYLSLILLQNYQQLNSTGFRKILKKHDKLLQTDRGHAWFLEHVMQAPFSTNKEIDNLISNTESIVTDQLESGNRQAAMKRLRVPPLSEAQSAWTTFRLGFFMGSFLILSLLVLLSIFVQNTPEEPRWVAVRLFRGFFLLFANVFLMGLNMYGWQSSGVNHVLIFEIEPRDHLTYQSLMEISSFFATIWALCVLGYLHHNVLDCPATIFPLILLSICLVWLFNPTPYFLKTSRFWFIRHIYLCFTAPFHRVAFADFWLADQMNSLITFFLDMEYLVCFYTHYVDFGDGLRMIVHDPHLNYTQHMVNSSLALAHHSGIL